MIQMQTQRKFSSPLKLRVMLLCHKVYISAFSSENVTSQEKTAEKPKAFHGTFVQEMIHTSE